jgi:hypothetical protein
MSDDVTMFLGMAAILVLITVGITGGCVDNISSKKARCQTVCAPSGCSDLGSGHSLCNDGRLIWRKQGQP